MLEKIVIRKAINSFNLISLCIDYILTRKYVLVYTVNCFLFLVVLRMTQLTFDVFLDLLSCCQSFQDQETFVMPSIISIPSLTKTGEYIFQKLVYIDQFDFYLLNIYLIDYPKVDIVYFSYLRHH